MSLATASLSAPQTPTRSTRLTASRRTATSPADGAELDQLLAAARAGDGAALGKLYDRYSPSIYRYLCRRVGDPALAEDLTSAVFLRVLEAIQAGNTWRESFTGWLYRIAHNMLVDHMRTRARRPETALNPDLPCPRSADLQDHAERACLVRDVRQALAAIKPGYSEVLLLRFGEGLSHEEVGERLGKRADSVKVTQFRALRALRRELAGSPNLAEA